MLLPPSPPLALARMSSSLSDPSASDARQLTPHSSSCSPTGCVPGVPTWSSQLVSPLFYALLMVSPNQNGRARSRRCAVCPRRNRGTPIPIGQHNPSGFALFHQENAMAPLKGYRLFLGGSAVRKGHEGGIDEDRWKGLDSRATDLPPPAQPRHPSDNPLSREVPLRRQSNYSRRDELAPTRPYPSLCPLAGCPNRQKASLVILDRAPSFRLPARSPID